MNIILSHFRRGWLEQKVALAIVALAFCTVSGTKASPAPTNAAPAAPSSAAVKVQDASAPIPPTPPVPPKADKGNDDDDQSFNVNIKTGDDHGHTSLMGEFIDDLIPLTGIVATFGTPVLIVFFVAYFKYRRRQENLAMAREFLNKGLTVPPELLNPTPTIIDFGSSDAGYGRPRSDFRKGCKLAFIGLGVTLALYIHSPNSTMWGWGLIPTVMGLGYLLSAFIENRQSPPPSAPRDYPGPGNPR